jgi:hypothetical protein
MTLLLWARFAFLAVLVALIAGYVWVGLRKHEE